MVIKTFKSNLSFIIHNDWLLEYMELFEKYLSKYMLHCMLEIDIIHNEDIIIWGANFVWFHICQFLPKLIYWNMGIWLLIGNILLANVIT